MRPLGLALLLLAPPLLAGCATTDEAPDVVATFYPLAFLASRIAGPNVTVASLVPPGVEPHEYEPTTTDLVRVGGAKLLVLQGAGFEAWAERARSQAKDTRAVVATTGLDLRESREAETGVTAPDPHTWLDPVLMANMSATVERALTDAFPEDAPAIRARGESLRAEFAALDDEYRVGLASCQTRFIISNHASFSYVASRYDFTQRGISGLSPDAEPDPRTLQELIDEARAHNVTIIFFEDLVSPRVAEIVAREAGASTRVLSPIEGIPLERQAEGADYFTLMRENLHGLREAMRCQ